MVRRHRTKRSNTYYWFIRITDWNAHCCKYVRLCYSYNWVHCNVNVVLINDDDWWSISLYFSWLHLVSLPLTNHPGLARATVLLALCVIVRFSWKLVTYDRQSVVLASSCLSVQFLLVRMTVYTDNVPHEPHHIRCWLHDRHDQPQSVSVAVIFIIENG